MAAAATKAILRSLLPSPTNSFSFRRLRHFLSPAGPPQYPPLPPCSSLSLNHYQLFSSDAVDNRKTNPKLVNFSLSDSDTDSDTEESKKRVDETKLPPPYDPFRKTPAMVDEPDDPKNLQLIFQRLRSEGGMFNHAVKMFDEMSRDGLTHEALQLFSHIKDKAQFPDVVAHTAVMEAYANAGGHSKEALKVFHRMQASGVSPNAYTYGVLIKGLVEDAKVAEAGRYMEEMVGKGMRPNAGVYTKVVEGFVRDGKVEEVKELVKKLKEKGFKPDEKGVREAIKDRRGQVYGAVIDILFDK